MVIKNKKTGIERFVTPEEWEQIRSNFELKDRFKVVDSKDFTKAATGDKTKPTAIIAKEVLDFKTKKIEELKNENKTKKPKK